MLNDVLLLVVHHLHSGDLYAMRDACPSTALEITTRIKSLWYDEDVHRYVFNCPKHCTKLNMCCENAISCPDMPEVITSEQFYHLRIDEDELETMRSCTSRHTGIEYYLVRDVEKRKTKLVEKYRKESLKRAKRKRDYEAELTKHGLDGYGPYYTGKRSCSISKVVDEIATLRYLNEYTRYPYLHKTDEFDVPGGLEMAKEAALKEYPIPPVWPWNHVST